MNEHWAPPSFPFHRLQRGTVFQSMDEEFACMMTIAYSIVDGQGE